MHARSPFPRKEPHANKKYYVVKRGTPCGGLLQLAATARRQVHGISRRCVQRICNSGAEAEAWYGKPITPPPKEASHAPAVAPKKETRANDQETLEKSYYPPTSDPLDDQHRISYDGVSDAPSSLPEDAHHLHRRLLPREPQWARRICRCLPHCRGQRSSSPFPAASPPLRTTAWSFAPPTKH